METQEQTINLWRIGEESEIFAAHSEQEVREYYSKLAGKYADEGLQSLFEKIPDSELDSEFDFYDDGEKRRTTLRKLAADIAIIPTQICSSYL